MSQTVPAPVDERLPWRQLCVFGLQHVLVMAASPIAAVFLMSKALSLPPALSVQLLSATFVICGLGTLLQSLGRRGVGARLPFVMLPGGAPIVLFILIAQQTSVQTAAGAVILTGVFYFCALPVFRRCLRYFPPVVVGTMLLLVAINLAQVSGRLIAGHPTAGAPVDPLNLLLAFVTVACTVAASRWFGGTLARLAILLGLVGGALSAIALGTFHTGQVAMSPLLALPTPFPFGWPQFDIMAALPLMVFAVISMVEATGQTLAISDAVGRPVDAGRDVPRTIRGDALTSLLGGVFGTSLIITSGENIGIVRATGVRSRYVTAMSGVILVVFGLLVPVSSLISAIPEAVVGGTGLVVFCIVGTMGIDVLRRVDLRDHANMYVVAVALAAGLLPILVPGIYGALPANLRILLGNGVAMGAFTAALLNFLFFHTGARRVADVAPATH
jgi:uracil-xanthine permease